MMNLVILFSIGSFTYFGMSPFILPYLRLYFTVCLMNLISAAVILVLSSAFMFRFLLPYKSVGKVRVFLKKVSHFSEILMI